VPGISGKGDEKGYPTEGHYTTKFESKKEQPGKAKRVRNKLHDRLGVISEKLIEGEKEERGL